jgi:epoxyqueuosine reductase
VLNRSQLRELAGRAGVDLAGVIPAGFVPDSTLFDSWVKRGRAAGMAYLTDHRAVVRQDPRRVMATAQTVLVAGVLYNTNEPKTLAEAERGWISRYAWGTRDYHDVVRERLERLASFLQQALGPFEYRVCVDTAPLLERSLARQAGLGWIGKNTCLIHEGQGSWFFLGEILMDAPVDWFELADGPPPDRCGTCRRCIDACPTEALVPVEGRWELESARCISYLTIEARHLPAEDMREAVGNHVFGCDICQDVCPWNRRALVTDDEAFAPVEVAPALEELAALSPEEFRRRFRQTPVWRTKHRGLLRNVAIAMGNSGEARFTEQLRLLAGHEDADVAAAAAWALGRLPTAER